MKTKLFIFLMLLPSVASAQMLEEMGYFSPDGVTRGNIDLNGYNILDVEDIRLDCATCDSLIYMAPQTTDVAGSGLTVKAGSAWGSNKAGGDLTICGGSGSDLITVTNAVLSALDEVEICIESTCATITEGTEFACVAATTNDCATNLAAAITTKWATLPAAATAAVVNITPADSVCNTKITVTDGGVDGAFAADTEGVNGHISLSFGTASESAIQFGDGALLGIGSQSGQMWFYANGARQARMTSAGFNIDVGLVLTAVDARMYNSVAALNFGKAATTSHGLDMDDVLVGDDLEVDGKLKLDGVQEDVGATCTTGDTAIDIAGATVEFCYCTTTDTWYCSAMAAGPAD